MYIGSHARLDSDLVKGANIPFTPIFTGKFRRYFSWRNIVDPFLVFIGFVQAVIILLRFRPHVVFSKGGYVSVPVVLAAFILRRPVILHESDSRMGLANRFCAGLSKKVCVAFPILVEKSPKFVLTGNPIRESILNGDRQKGFRLTGFKEGKPVVLVWGGSQGAQQINEIIQREFNELKNHFQIIHITGVGKSIPIEDEHYKAFEYLGEDLRHIYAITDFVVGRSGANSLYELAVMGKPNIVIPLANADQQLNAEYFIDQGASIPFEKNNRLSEVLVALWHNPEKQAEMKAALKSVARPNAAQEIADILFKVVEQRNNEATKQQ